MLAFLSLGMGSCVCVPQCLNGLLCLCFSVFVWTLVLEFPSLGMDSCVCIPQCLNGLLCLRFSVFVWTLVRALVLVSQISFTTEKPPV